MADDAFKRIQPGQTFRPAAKVWNSMLDVVEEYRARTGFGQAGIDTGVDGRIWIQNDTADTLPQFSIVGIGEAITSPQDDEAEFIRTMCFGSISPLTAARFAIIQDGIEADTVGEARVVGLTHCYVDRTTTAHNFANPADGNYDNLVSATTGTAEILWIDDLPAAAIGETVHEGTSTPSSGLGDDGDYYKDTDSDEYYGPKTAGSWGSAHDYGTGICWAVVVMDQMPEPVTSLNGETGDVRIGLGRSGTGPNLASTATAWSSAIEYQVGDVVSLSGSNYYCILKHTNHTPPNATYWTVTTEDLIVANLPDASDVNRGQVNLLPTQQFGGDLKYVAGTYAAGMFRVCMGNPVGAGGALVNVDSWDWAGVPPTSTTNPGFSITYTVGLNHVSYNINGIGTYNQNHTYEAGECVAFEGYIYSALSHVSMGSYPSPSITYPTPSGFWEKVYDTANIYKPLLALSTYGFMYPTHGYMATEVDPTFATGGVPANVQPVRGFYGTIFGLKFGGGILLRGGSISIPGTYITPGTLPTASLAPAFYLPAANAGTVLEAENKEGSTVAAGMVVATHSSGSGFTLADASGTAKPATGITRESIANTVSGKVQTEGLITLADWTASTGSSTLAAKANYFSDPANPGKMTTTAPSTTGHVTQLVGVAVSTDTMDLKLESPILL